MIASWTLFALYVVGTLWLARLGQRRTTTFESYALGDGRMHPFVAGMALAASMTSTATLVINPGIVYAYGLSAVLGYGVAAGVGLILGIIVFSKAFRRHGAGQRILTVPQWIGRRWGDERLTLLYAVINLFLVAMVVMICYAMAGLLLATLDLERLVPGWGFEAALAGIVLFVFAYVFVGGTFAHAYTNTLQGVMMVVVAALLIGSGVHLFADGQLLERLAAIDPALATPVNPGSLLFRNAFEVFGANFLIGVALALQPHFLVKALYVENERQVDRYLTIAVAAGIVFNLVLLCGLFARIERGAEVAEFMARSGLGIDGVMPAYIVATFPPLVQSFVAVAILAAGMSTLDGILVALSAIFANDVVLVVRRLRGRGGEADADAALAFRVGRFSLVVLGLVAFVLALVQHRSDKLSIAIFAQEGVYALLVATFVPLLFGLFGKGLAKGVVVIASLVALAVHFGFRYGGISLLTTADGINPGLTAAYALIASLAVALAGRALFGRG
jgi:SSS family solute:Na+ symporter/sodium/pantothenate symporter